MSIFDFNKKFFQQSAGLSMLELLVTVSLISIFAGVAVFNYQKGRESYQRMDVIHKLANDISLARLKSVTEGGRGIIVPDASGTSYSFGYDYLTPDYATVAPITYDAVGYQFTTELPSNFKITITSTIDDSEVPIIFDSKGRVIDELGILRSHDIEIEFDGEVYKTATLSPGGVLKFND